jgi:hypothetical protein
MEGQFTKLNESFTCLNCGKFVEKDLNGSSRNHCNFCLCSVHLDITPGDRLSQCHGRMFPIDIISIGGKNIIFHKIIYEAQGQIGKTEYTTHQFFRQSRKQTPHASDEA